MSSSVQVGGRRRGNLEHFLIVAGLFTLLGTLWLGWKYDTLDNLKNYLQQQEQQGSDLELGSEDWAASLANITILESAVSIGAVCLDGSPPAYYWHRGSGTGVNNWLVFLEGGGWCTTDEECFQRSLTSIGSSKYMGLQAPMDGVLSSSPSVNPDFYNWNRVLVKYCDGGSFNGYVSEPKQVSMGRNGRYTKDGKVSNLFFRGQGIWQAVIEDLLNRGMNKAHKALLGGCSAGGLASILHCDQFQELMPKSASVKCFSDAGFFLHVPDVSGAAYIEEFYKRVVLLQNMSKLLPEACTSKRNFTQCFFPQYLISSIKTPFFMLNPAYDTWQFANVLIPPASDPLGSWKACRISLSFCSESQLLAVQGFRDDLLKALMPLLEGEKDGAYIDSCYSHCQGQDDYNWNSVGGPKVDNKSPAQALADWYFGKNGTKVIDCPFPCNPTCGAFNYG